MSARASCPDAASPASSTFSADLSSPVKNRRAGPLVVGDDHPQHLAAAFASVL
jgi:hypothetical protein